MVLVQCIWAQFGHKKPLGARNSYFFLNKNKLCPDFGWLDGQIVPAFTVFMILKLNIHAFFDVLFGSVLTMFISIGVILILIAILMVIVNLRFRGKAVRVTARVIGLVNNDRARPVFEVLDDAYKGAQHETELGQINRVYPKGSDWPAWYNLKSGKIQADHMIRDNWIVVFGFIIVGLAFFLVPQLANWAFGDNMLVWAFMSLGSALIIFGVVYSFRLNRARRRFEPASVTLIDYYSVTDSDGDKSYVSVFRLETGRYQGVETSDAWVGGVDEDDIGERFNGEFDPYTFRLFITDRKFRAINFGASAILTGFAFIAFGVGIAVFG